MDLGKFHVSILLLIAHLLLMYSKNWMINIEKSYKVKCITIETDY